jgi:ubiquinone biosynthesis protein
VQPQLVLLQKTLLNVEGLGRQLDPDLDLWKTAKPFLERWMHEQIGWRGMLERFKEEAPRLSQLLPELPRLAHQVLQAKANPIEDTEELLRRVLVETRRMNLLLGIIVYLAGGAVVGVLLVQLTLRWHHLFG